MVYDVPLRVAVAGNVDAGKCFGVDTPIMLHNGRIKKVQDIRCNDILMGDDNKLRVVVRTVIGKDIMYKIKIKRGGYYIVNSLHILCLKRSNIENIICDKINNTFSYSWWENLKIFSKKFYYNKNNKEEIKIKVISFIKDVKKRYNYSLPHTIIHINVKDYINLKEEIKENLYGYKKGANFKYRPLNIESYCFGKQIGIKFLNNENINIPDIYKYNSNKNQAKLLAGFLDTIPIKHDLINTLCIKYKFKEILENLQFIFRSLQIWSNIIKLNNNKFKLNFKGNLEIVPTKNIKFENIENEYLYSKIEIEEIGEDIYYGFTIEGNNQRFLLGDFTVTHNSSFLGMIKTGRLDDGNGLVRKHIFNYPHEKITGRTSSVAQRTLIVKKKKIIFFDLAGHEKYFRTTLFGISSSYPDTMLVLIESNKGVQKMTKEHIISAIYLRIPIIIVMTKIDIAIPNKLNSNIRKIKKMMKSVGKKIFEVKDENSILIAKNRFSENFIPLFKISVVKGNNINPPIKYLENFLNILNSKKADITNNDTLFIIDKSFKTKGYPLIGSGSMISGKINVNEKLFLGPFHNEYIEIIIRSIHDDDRNNVSFLRKNELGCISFKSKNCNFNNKRHIVPGMIITNKKHSFVKKFIGIVTIFSSHSTSIKVGYNTIIHTCAIKKCVKITKIIDNKEKDIECLRGGDKDIKVHFQFIGNPQFIRKNDIFIFREGNTRGSGKIISTIL